MNCPFCQQEMEDGVPPAASNLGYSNLRKDIINSVFCYSWFQFAHIFNLLILAYFLQV